MLSAKNTRELPIGTWVKMTRYSRDSDIYGEGLDPYIGQITDRTEDQFCIHYHTDEDDQSYWYRHEIDADSFSLSYPALNPYDLELL